MLSIVKILEVRVHLSRTWARGDSGDCFRHTYRGGIALKAADDTLRHVNTSAAKRVHMRMLRVHVLNNFSYGENFVHVSLPREVLWTPLHDSGPRRKPQACSGGTLDG